MPGSRPSPTYTLGHGRLPGKDLVGLLKAHGVDLVVDVRAVPFSRANPEANQQALAKALKEAGIGYLWMGDRLGGKPRGKKGALDVAAKLADPRFWEGIEALLKLREEGSTLALLCAEEDPRRCHRRFLVTRALLEKGIPPEEVRHIRHDGRVESEAEIQAEEAPLFRGELP